MAFLRASLRAAVQVGYAPHIALSKLNNLLWDSVEEHQFITAIYGILDVTNRTFVFSNAGHNPPLLIKPNGEYRFVEYGDLPLRNVQRNPLSPAFHSVRPRPGDGYLHGWDNGGIRRKGRRVRSGKVRETGAGRQIPCPRSN